MRVHSRSRFRHRVCSAKPQPTPKELLQLSPYYPPIGGSQIRISDDFPGVTADVQPGKYDLCTLIDHLLTLDVPAYATHLPAVQLGGVRLAFGVHPGHEVN